MTPVSPDTFLSQARLAELGPDVLRPGYGRAGLTPGIVHFGPGAFHRAHQAWFVDKLLAHDPRWNICGVSLRSADVRDALVPQDGLYTLATLDERLSYQVIGSITELLVAPEDPGAVLNRLAAPTTQVVTITVTEKGYGEAGPTSLVGYLVEGLRRRRAAGLGSLTVISCDNMVDNGARLGRAVGELAQAGDPGLARWIEDHVCFPRTMVDSITPATTAALKERVSGVLGVGDRWPVQRESFAQWVLEDRLAPGGPDWGSVGVIITDDVAAYDRAKLRLLNGAHSTLAYLGLLAGHETVAEAMADRKLCSFVSTLMREDIRPTLRGLDLESYIETILRRFRNPAIKHALAQIAWDGSQKLPFRILGTIADNLAAGRPIERLCVPIAAWMHFVRRQACRGERVTDPLAARLFEIGVACQNRSMSDVPAFLGLGTVFPADLAHEPLFANGLARAYDDLAVEG